MVRVAAMTECCAGGKVRVRDPGALAKWSGNFVLEQQEASALEGAVMTLGDQWLAEYGVDADQIAGLIPLSGHTITHMTVRKEKGMPKTQPLVDEFAPLYHVRPDSPPILLITGDRKMEILGRYEENAYFMRILKVVGHKDVTLFELQGYGHGMVEPAIAPMLKWAQDKASRAGAPEK